MTDLDKMKKSVDWMGYKYNIFDNGLDFITLEVVGFNSGHRLACFEFNKADGSFRFEDIKG